MNQKMDEKKVNDKSFEYEKQQRQRKKTAPDASQPAMSYREVRAGTVSVQKKKKRADKSNQGSKNPSQGSNENRPQQVQQKKRSNTPIGATTSDKSHRKQQNRPNNGQQQDKQKQDSKQQSKSQNPKKVQVQQGKSHDSRQEHSTSADKKKQNQESAASSRSSAQVHRETSAAQKEGETQQKQPRPTSEVDVKEKKEKIQKPLKPAKPFSAKNRRRKIFALYSTMVLVILVIAAFLCLTVFFKIDSISVDGDTRYSNNEIINASGIAIGTNLLLCDTDSGIDVIKNKFPYIENVSIRKNPFNSVTIFVEEAKPTTAVETNGKFYILSANGKIIEILDSNKYNVPLIKGAELEKTELSAIIEYKLESMNDIINQITETLKNNEINNVSTIDVTNPSNIKLSYDKRLTVIIGMPENIDYKIKTAKILINDKLEKDSKGTVDVSMCAEGGKYSYYDPSGAPEN